MHLFEENIKNLGLNIPELPKALANYVPFKIVGKTMYISGQAPVRNGEMIFKGYVTGLIMLIGINKYRPRLPLPCFVLDDHITGVSLPYMILLHTPRLAFFLTRIFSNPDQIG